MDEPLSNLDANLRVQMRSELKLPSRQASASTTLYVTHDQVEAMTMGDRVAVLSPVSRADDRNLQQMRPAGRALQQARPTSSSRLHRQPGDEPLRGVS